MKSPQKIRAAVAPAEEVVAMERGTQNVAAPPTAARTIAPRAISRTKTPLSTSSKAAEQTASTREAKTEMAAASVGNKNAVAENTEGKSPKKTASTRDAKKEKAVAKIAKLRVRADVSWTQSADTLAKNTEASRAAVTKIAKRACEYSLRRAPLQNADLLSRLQEKVGVAIDITFVDDEEIAQLNADYRGKPRATDVLSFAQGEGEENDGFFALQGAPLMLGDIIVSLETALRQANELRHELSVEIAFLVAHGTLHLIGYDHGKDAARRVMFALQDEIVEELFGAVAPAS